MCGRLNSAVCRHDQSSPVRQVVTAVRCFIASGVDSGKGFLPSLHYHVKAECLLRPENSEATVAAELAGQADDRSMNLNREIKKAQIGPHLLEPRRGCAVRGIALSGLPAETFCGSQLLAF